MRHFSHSSMATWRRCRTRYKWQYVDNYTTATGLGQSRGTVGHATLAEWYKNGYDDEKAMKLASQMYCDIESQTGNDLSKDWELMEVILPRYFAWARENDHFSEIVSLEQKFEIKIADQTIIGYIDGVVKSSQGSIWLLEHKFNKKVALNNIDLDPQMSLYMLAAYKMGIEAKGVIFNVIRVAEGGIAETEPVARVQVYRNAEGLAVIEEEVKLQLKEMAKFHTEGGLIYRNPTKDCSWDCGFYPVCLSMNDNGDAQSILSKFTIVTHEDEETTEKGGE